jgi:hypothetical protein
MGTTEPQWQLKVHSNDPRDVAARAAASPQQEGQFTIGGQTFLPAVSQLLPISTDRCTFSLPPLLPLSHAYDTVTQCWQAFANHDSLHAIVYALAHQSTFPFKIRISENECYSAPPQAQEEHRPVLQEALQSANQ